MKNLIYLNYLTNLNVLVNPLNELSVLSYLLSSKDSNFAHIVV